ncbi:MAG: hypothetical protein ABIQ33_04695 [Caldimonas sp.]
MHLAKSLCSLLCLPLLVLAEPGPLGISRVDTADLRLLYADPSLNFLVPHTARTFSNALDWQRRIFGWVPSQRTTIWLRDFADYGNAGVSPAPNTLLRIDVAPAANAFETNPSSERMYSTMNHEMVHVATTDVSSSEDRRWRELFLGKVAPQSAHPESLLYSYLTVPRFVVPRWYLEGSAVFMETWMGGGLGRSQGGYDEMVFRAMVRDGARFYDPLGLVSRGTRIDFQVGANAYLYGARFFTWLAYAHSPEKVVTWLRRDEGSRRHYADQFEQVFGTPLDRAWQDWIAFEHDFQRRNLAEVRRHPITPQRNLAATALGSVSRAYFDESTGVLYAGVRYPGIVDHVAALDTRDGSARALAEIKGAMLYSVTSLAFDPAHRTAFFTTDNLGLRNLIALEVDSGRQTSLLKEARVGSVAFNPVDRSLMGVRHESGLATIVRIPYPYDHWEPVHAFPYGVVPSELDVSSDGRLLSASITDVGGNQFLRVWTMTSLLAGNTEALSEFRFGQSAPEGFVFTKDGRYLYGSSYYTGVSNIFRYEVATGDVKAVSNAETGYFRPIPMADGRLIVFSYTGQGFTPAIIEPRPIEDLSAIRFLGTEVVARHPVVTTWQVPAARNVDFESQVTATGVYRPLGELQLLNAFPVLQGYKTTAGVGYHVNIGDPLGFARLGITAAYTPGQGLPGNERGHIDLSGRYLGWRAGLSWNRSNFYDLFGPVRRGRKGYAAKLGYDQYLIFEPPRKLDLSYDLAYYDKIDTLPAAQNVDAKFDRLLTGEIALHYTDVRRSLAAVDDEKGVTWTAVATGHRVKSSTVTQLRGGLDVGVPLPLAHSSIWSRSAAGLANGDRSNPIVNYYFGGFGNNVVDDGAVKRYREYASMPGFRIDEIGGRTFVKQMIEWNLPPLVFESLGQPSFHLQSLRPALFASALWTDPQDSALRKRYHDLGAQIDVRLSVLHWYDMTLSTGFAIGYKGSRRSSKEWMVSLKIL